MICISGDIIDSDKKIIQKTSLSEQKKYVINWLKNFAKPVFICSGNRDVDDGVFSFEWLNTVQNKNIFTDGSIKNISGIKIGCIPYYGDNLMRYKDCDIILHHLPPAKTSAAFEKDGDNNDWGCEILYSAIRRKLIHPKYILCGHVHNPEKNIASIEGVAVSNPGMDITKDIPNHFIIKI